MPSMAGRRGVTPVASTTCVEAGRSQFLGADARVELELDAGELDLAAEEAQRLVELFLARYLLGDVELAADLAGGVEQRHVEAALGRGGGKAQAGRAGADHRDAALGLWPARC